MKTLLALSMTLAATAVHAEVLELEGVVKAVDAAARTITIERKTPKGLKTFDLDVAKTVLTLKNVRVGSSLSLRYDPDLELVTGMSGKVPPMSAKELVTRLRVFEPPPAGITQQDANGRAIERLYALGYLNAVADVTGRIYMCCSQLDIRGALIKHLEAHPEDGLRPAHLVMIEAGILKEWEGEQ